MTVEEIVELADWRRRVAELYAQVRAERDPQRAWTHWRAARDELFRDHTQSPRPGSPPLAYFDYDPALRLTAELEPADGAPVAIDGIVFFRVATAQLEFGSLDVYWLDAYPGGLFVPFADATNGRETYGAGRYVVDSAKGADLGMDGDRLVLDFNFAYNPSCAYDPRWACPLAPAGNRLASPIRAGERS